MAKLLYAVALSLWLALAVARAGPAEDANAVVVDWSKSYSANDMEALLSLYADDAIPLGTTEPRLSAIMQFS